MWLLNVLTLRSSCMSSSSLVVGGSDDGFDALLSTLFILLAMGCLSGAAGALPFAAVREVPIRTICDCDKNKLL
jgi:hypothetical protein